MDDLISRAAALDTIDHERKILIEQNRFGAEHVVVHHARRIIEELPAVDAIPVEWLKSKRKEALHEGMRPDEVEAVEMVLWMWQKEQEAQDG